MDPSKSELDPGFQPKDSTRRRAHRRDRDDSGPTYDVNFPIYAPPDSAAVPQDQRQMVPRTTDIVQKRYATSVDSRNFLTVYEYSVNNQWVIWDYHTGYVHLTGLWKAVGNNKADIVKLVDNSPDLEPVIRRVRGGFLKIQGTWLPFDVARQLAARTCYHIRYALVPVFGPDFPGQCLTPDEQGFGQLQLYFTERRRRKRRRVVKSPDGTKRVQLEGFEQARQQQPPPPPPGQLMTPLVTPPMSTSLFQLTPSQLTHLSPHLAERHSQAESARRHTLPEPPTLITAASSGAGSANPMSRPRAATFSAGSGPIAAPPLPGKLSLSDEHRLVQKPGEFLELLQATRSLQQMQTPSGFDMHTLGGGFECAGKLWRWDGKQQLNIVGESTPRGMPDLAYKLTPPTSPVRGVMDISGLLS